MQMADQEKAYLEEVIAEARADTERQCREAVMAVLLPMLEGEPADEFERGYHAAVATVIADLTWKAGDAK